MLLGQNIRRTDGEVRDMKRHSLRLRNQRNPSQYHITIWKRVTKENLAKEMLAVRDHGAVTKIYATFTSMPYACKEHIQVYVVAK